MLMDWNISLECYHRARWLDWLLFTRKNYHFLLLVFPCVVRAAALVTVDFRLSLQHLISFFLSLLFFREGIWHNVKQGVTKSFNFVSPVSRFLFHETHLVSLIDDFIIF